MADSESHSFCFKANSQQYEIIFDTKLLQDGFVGTQVNVRRKTQRLVCRKVNPGEQTKIKKLALPMPFKPMLNIRENVNANKPIQFEFYYEVWPYEEVYAKREDSVNDLKMYEESNIALFNQQYNLFLCEGKVRPSFSFQYQSNSLNYLVTFDSKLECEDGFVGTEICLTDSTERMVCRKLKQKPTKHPQKLKKPKSKLKECIVEVNSLIQNPQAPVLEFYFEVRSWQPNYKEIEGQGFGLEPYLKQDSYCLLQEYIYYLQRLKKDTHSFTLRTKRQSYEIEFKTKQITEGFVGTQKNKHSTLLRRVYMKPFQPGSPALQRLLPQAQSIQEVFYYEVLQTDPNYHSREDLARDLKRYDEQQANQLRKQFDQFMKSESETHQFELLKDSSKYKVEFYKKLRGEGRIGTQESKSAKRKRGIFVKLEHTARPESLASIIEAARGGVFKRKEIKELDKQSPKYEEVEKHFRHTMRGKIVKIEQVIDGVKELHFKFVQQTLINQGKSCQTKYLFHGSRGKEAQELIDSENGLDPQYSDKGMWGRAVYFAVNASYSNEYAHRFQNNTKELLYCKVIVGNAYECLPDNKIRNPPLGYTSVKGFTQGSEIYMIYKNYLCLIDCIVTYKN